MTTTRTAGHRSATPRWTDARNAVRLTALIYVLFFTGSRISEVLGADVRDYRSDHGHRVLRIRRKGGKIASVVLPAPAIRALDALIGERTSGPIFLNRDGAGRYAYRSVHSQLRRLALSVSRPPSASSRSSGAGRQIRR